MANRSTFLILILVRTLSCYFFSNPCYAETDTLLQGQELKDWDYLISSNKVFTLKFFGFGTSISPYLGIFYNPLRSNTRTYPYLKIYDQRLARINYANDGNDNVHEGDKAVWVANRNNPSKVIYGKLMIDIHSKLSILSGGGTVVDLFSPPTLVTRNASATLLDTGNFVPLVNRCNRNNPLNVKTWLKIDINVCVLYPDDSEER